MHIMEGFLPWQWCLLWYLLAVPVVAYGVLQIKQITDKNPESKPLLAVSGAFIFVLSSLKLPSVTGSSSHPTGSGLSAILFGPAVTCVLAVHCIGFSGTSPGPWWHNNPWCQYFFNGDCWTFSCMDHLQNNHKNRCILFNSCILCCIYSRCVHICNHCITAFTCLSNTQLWCRFFQVYVGVCLHPDTPRTG